jgi:hypothetical protein
LHFVKKYYLCVTKQNKKAMTTTNKIYNLFTDRFNNEYKFNTYMDFACFWFNISRKAALELFPHNFKNLQKAAANSKEARTKVY